MKSFFEELVEKIHQTSSSISTSLSGIAPGKLAMLPFGRASGKSMSFAMNYVTMGASVPSPRRSPTVLTLPCEGNTVRATIDETVTITVYHGTMRGPMSRKGRKVVEVSLDAARLLAREMRRVDVARVELDGRDGEVEVQRRGPGARDANDRSRLRLLFRPAEGDTVTVRATHRRVRTFASRLEAEVNRIALDEVMRA